MAPNKPTQIAPQKAHSDIMNSWDLRPEKEALIRCTMRRCATSPVPAARKVLWQGCSLHRLARNKANFFFSFSFSLWLLTLDLIIDDSSCVGPISCSAEADFSTERVPRAATRPLCCPNYCEMSACRPARGRGHAVVCVRKAFS